MNIHTPIATCYGDWIPRFKDLWTQQVGQLQEKFREKIADIQMPWDRLTDVPVVYVQRASIVEVLSFLKRDPAFDYSYLADQTAIDNHPQDPRFEVVYNLFSHTRFNRIRIKVRVRENEEVPPAISVWEGANWAEREIFDMFGIKFSGHPDLRRIVMDLRWVGHPLRKDYPLRGYQVFPTPEPIDPKLLKD